MVKIGVVWGVKGHPRSSKTSPFDRGHMTSYSTLIETIRLSCTVFAFLPRDALLCAVYAVVVCLSVRLFVCVCLSHSVLYENG